MVVWLAKSWLIAVATLVQIAVPFAVPVLLGAAIRAAVCMMVITVLLLDSFLFSSAKTLYIIWLEYPFWPNVLQSGAIAVRRQLYASCMKVLRACLEGNGFPRIKFLEGGYVGLDEEPHRVCNDLIIKVR